MDNEFKCNLNSNEMRVFKEGIARKNKGIIMKALSKPMYLVITAINNSDKKTEKFDIHCDIKGRAISITLISELKDRFIRVIVEEHGSVTYKEHSVNEIANAILKGCNAYSVISTYDYRVGMHIDDIRDIIEELIENDNRIDKDILRQYRDGVRCASKAGTIYKIDNSKINKKKLENIIYNGLIEMGTKGRIRDILNVKYEMDLQIHNNDNNGTMILQKVTGDFSKGINVYYRDARGIVAWKYGSYKDVRNTDEIQMKFIRNIPKDSIAKEMQYRGMYTECGIRHALIRQIYHEDGIYMDMRLLRHIGRNVNNFSSRVTGIEKIPVKDMDMWIEKVSKAVIEQFG